LCSRRAFAQPVSVRRAKDHSMWVVEAISRWFSKGMNDAWRWLAALDFQEWFLLLGIVSAAGFMCMKGMGSRKEY